MKFSHVLLSLLVVTSLGLAGPAQAQQAYPSKPIHMVSAYPPGGSVTLVARIIADKLSENLGQPVVIDNKPGASTSIGSEFVMRASPDGYTLLLAAATLVLYPYMIPATLDVTKDLAAVANVGSGDLILAVHPSLPVNNLQELIALAKSKPGQLNYSTSGAGGLTHLAMEQLSLMTGMKLKHIPYKGAGPATTDLLGGQVQLAFQTPVAVLQHVKAGKLKAIAYTGTSRMAALPQVPTFAEAGVPNFEPRTCYGVLAPAGTPKAIIDKLAAEIAKIVTMPEVREKLANEGIDAAFFGPDRFGALVRSDFAMYGKLFKEANIKLEN